MPYISKQISPVQYHSRHTSQGSQFYKGFSTVDSTALDVKLYDFDLIKQDLLNQFQIRKGERVMNPTFGTIIWDLLYDPFTDNVKSQIASDVTRIVTADPRAKVLEINIVSQEYGILLEITLVYVGTDQTDVMRISFDKTAGLTTV